MALCDLRIGTGFDVHPFAQGRPLYLGGIEIEHQLGLEGHSDADVLLHSITDALLGALNWGDIGQWFPNTDERYRGKRSSFFLEQVWTKASAEGWKLINCDNVILAEAPKIAPHIERMSQAIAGMFSAEPAQISIKATTTERLGFVGRGEGIAAQTVILIHRE